MSVKDRVLVSEKISPLGAHRASYYSSGLLAISDFDAPAAKNQKDEPAAFIRLNNTNDPTQATLRRDFTSLVFDVLGKLGPENKPTVTFSYASHLHGDYLQKILSMRKEDPLFRFALFAGIVQDAKGIPFEVLLEKAEANRHRMEEVVRFNAWSYFLREDLGFISSNLPAKAASLEAFQEKNRVISERMKNPIWKTALDRIAEGVVTATIERMKRPYDNPNNRFSDGISGADFIFTHDEKKEFASFLRGVVPKLMPTADVVRVVAYAKLAHGEEKARELYQFIASQQDAEPEMGWMRTRNSISLTTSAHPDGPLLESRLFEALENSEGLPFDWAYEIADPNLDLDAQGSDPADSGVK